MAITNATVTVLTAPILLASGAKGTLYDPVPVTVIGSSTGVFLGGSSVTTANGIAAGTTPLSFALIQGDDLYGISAGSIAVNVMKGRQ